MGRGCHGHGHSDDDDAGGTPYDQSVEEMDFLRSACAAAQRGQTDKLRAMLDRKPESLNWDGVAGNSGYTPLHYAAREGQVDCVRLLLQRGALVNNKTTAGGATPLHRAAYTGRTEICRLLLKHGADQKIKDSDGQTAYFKACAQGHRETAAMLLEASPAVAAIADSKGDLPALPP